MRLGGQNNNNNNNSNVKSDGMCVPCTHMLIDYYINVRIMYTMKVGKVGCGCSLAWPRSTQTYCFSYDHDVMI